MSRDDTIPSSEDLVVQYQLERRHPHLIEIISYLIDAHLGVKLGYPSERHLERNQSASSGRI
jgi:hypothetical protein